MADHLQLDAARAKVSFSSENLLGHGGFADVYRGTYRFPTHAPVHAAFKLFKNSQILDAKLLELVQSEALVGSRLQHEHIVGMYGVLKLDAGLALVLELAEGGSLWKQLRATEPLPWQQRMEWLLGVARGIAYLHGVRPTPIIHRDLKAANVLLGSAADGRSIAKVSDFGLAQTMQTIRTTISHAGGSSRAGTLAWKAPETFRGKYSDKSDIFGFAMIIYETVSRAAPFEGQFDPEITKKLSDMFQFDQDLFDDFDLTEEQQRVRWLKKNPLASRRPDLARVEAGCPEPLLELMQSCWADDPGSRPAAVDCVKLLEHASGGLFGPELHYAIERDEVERVRGLFE
eukprot:COSAG03_NODE_3398_length_2040_cov_2.899021_1_plen_343_part_10